MLQKLNKSHQYISKFLNIDKLIAVRRDIHQNPEGGFNEYRTSATIKNYLKSEGATDAMFKTMAKTGFTFSIQGKAPTSPQGINTIAFRSDIDALQMDETNFDLKFRSTNGFAHMCGHDGHMSMLMAAGSVFLKNRHKIPSNKEIRLIFQPAEETCGGAKHMINEGCLDGVDEIYGAHILPTIPIGLIGVKPDYMSTNVRKIKISIVGKSTHGTTPELGNDAISAGVSVHNAISNILNMRISKREFCLLTICKMHSGSADNVISDKCEMTGTMRTFKEDVANRVTALLRNAVEQSCRAYGCEGNIEFIEGYPAIKNNEQCAKSLWSTITNCFGSDVATEKECPFFASEDFAFYTNKIPGAFAFIGSKEKEGQPYLHSNNFTFNEMLIPYGANLWTAVAEDKLKIKLG